MAPFPPPPVIVPSDSGIPSAVLLPETPPKTSNADSRLLPRMEKPSGALIYAIVVIVILAVGFTGGIIAMMPCMNKFWNGTTACRVDDAYQEEGLSKNSLDEEDVLCECQRKAFEGKEE